MRELYIFGQSQIGYSAWLRSNAYPGFRSTASQTPSSATTKRIFSFLFTPDNVIYTGRHTFGAFAVQQTGNLFAVRGSDKVKPSRVRIVKRAMGLMEVKKALGSMRGIPQELSAAQHTVSIPDITAYLRPLTAELLRLEAAIDNGASPKPPIDLLIV